MWKIFNNRKKRNQSDLDKEKAMQLVIQLNHINSSQRMGTILKNPLLKEKLRDIYNTQHEIKVLDLAIIFTKEQIKLYEQCREIDITYDGYEINSEIISDYTETLNILQEIKERQMTNQGYNKT